MSLKLKKKHSVLHCLIGLISLLATATSTHAQIRLSELGSTETVQFDNATTFRFGSSLGCGSPDGTIQRHRSVYEVRLNAGDVGRCPGDDEARFGAPFQERAFLYPDPLPKRDRTYRVSAEFFFDPSTRSSDQSVFFQVHQSNGDLCRCWPLFQILVDAQGHIFIRAPERRSQYLNYQVPNWTRRDFEQRWVEVAIEVSTASGEQFMDVYVGGERVFRGLTMLRDGGWFAPHFGLYRPGSNAGNPTDRVFIQNARYSRVN